ncbi:hypothetical protein D3C84_1246360 [compost metagenome]
MELPVRVAHSIEQFEQQLKAAVAERKDLKLSDSMRQEAGRHSWHSRLETVLHVLNQREETGHAANLLP